MFKKIAAVTILVSIPTFCCSEMTFGAGYKRGPVATRGYHAQLRAVEMAKTKKSYWGPRFDSSAPKRGSTRSVAQENAAQRRYIANVLKERGLSPEPSRSRRTGNTSRSNSGLYFYHPR